MNIENELWPNDTALFQRMSQRYNSENEKRFFETLKQKMQSENAPWPEVLISEYDNDEKIYLLRQTYDEFMLGRGCNRQEWQTSEIHTSSLAETLQVNMKEANLADKDITFLQWLEECDFSCLKYDHSNDGNYI
jgi:hypothetical protein